MKTPEQLEYARELVISVARANYCVGSNDDIEIEPDAKLSRAEEGTWVQAWVYVPDEELADDDTYR